MGRGCGRGYYTVTSHAGLGMLPSGDALAAIPRVDGRPPRGIGADIASDAPVSMVIGNLLPQANATLTLPSEGVYVGDGLPPVPPKLAKKIRRGDFVEMGELLPEFWSSWKEEDGESRKGLKPRKTRTVTDIHTWVQCFSSYVATRAPQAPELIPELMAYLATIVRVSQDYSGMAWVRYDAAFRRQAALTSNRRWSAINPTLYTMCFAGMAAVTKRCELCLATTHTERECAQRGDPDPDMRDRLKTIESAVVALTKREEPPRHQGASRPSGEPCRKWNSSGCTFPRCGGDHPASRCTVRTPSGATPAGTGRAAPQNRPY